MKKGKPYDPADPLPDILYFDSDVKGFGLRVWPSGQKNYVLQYRDAGGRTRRIRIGEHGAMTPDQARAILEVAHSFADELATMNPHFDRPRFIHAATTDPS